MRRLLTFGGAAALLAFVGCNKTPGEVARPNQLTGQHALGELACQANSETAEPLVVDWGPEKRGDLEIAMRDSVAVVHYDCNSIHLLNDCKLGGNYTFSAITTKEHLVRLDNADELKANLPLSGVGLAGKLEGELKQGATIDVAMVLIGRKATTRAVAVPADLTGRCEGATHFVRRASIGAFTMTTGSRGAVRTVAEVFNAGAQAQSNSAKFVTQRDGEMPSCAKNALTATSAPEQCGAVLRLELTPVGKTTEVLLAKGACPEGFVASEGKCTRKATAAHFTCTPEKLNECSEQCEKGDAPSCYALGVHYQNSTTDFAGAAKAYERACALGHGDGCGGFAASLIHGRGVAKDTKRGSELAQKGCDLGGMRACYNYGVTLANGLGIPPDPVKARTLYERACNGGRADGCTNLGFLMENGQGGPTDPATARQLYERACAGGGFGSAMGCSNLGHAMRDGRGGDKDLARSAKLFEEARKKYENDCNISDAQSCDVVGNDYRWGNNGASKDPVRALALFRKGCSLRWGSACANLGFMLEAGEGAPPNQAEANTTWEKSCNELDDGQSCYLFGWRIANGKGITVDVPRARELYLKACDLGSSDGCNNAAVTLARGSAFEVEKAVKLYSKACDLGNNLGCSNLAGHYADGRGVPPDYAKARTLYQKACDQKIYDACYSLGKMFFGLNANDKKDVYASAKLFETACEVGKLSGACSDLGLQYQDGQGVSQSYEKAFTLFEKACAGKSKTGCANLANVYLKGQGTKRDPKKAIDPATESCNQGWGWGCDLLREAKKAKP